MKTSCRITSSLCLTIRKALSWAGLARSIGRILPVLAGIALVQLSLVSHVNAAGPDGQYQVVSASGSLKIGGETIDLSNSTTLFKRRAYLARVAVRNSKLELYPGDAFAVIRNMWPAFKNDTTILSQLSPVELKKKGAIHNGTTKQPLVMTFSGSNKGQKISGRMQWTYKVVVRGRKLIATARISGSVAGMKASGICSATCRKQ